RRRTRAFSNTSHFLEAICHPRGQRPYTGLRPVAGEGAWRQGHRVRRGVIVAGRRLSAPRGGQTAEPDHAGGRVAPPSAHAKGLSIRFETEEPRGSGTPARPGLVSKGPKG